MIKAHGGGGGGGLRGEELATSFGIIDLSTGISIFFQRNNEFFFLLE